MRIQVIYEFKGKSYGVVEEFANLVLLKMDGVARYHREQALVDEMKPLLATFTTAVAMAADGGKNNTKNKNLARVALEDNLVDIGTMLQLYAKGNELYVTDAGYKVKQKAVQNKRPFDAPELDWLRRATQSGTIEGAVKKFPKGVTEIAIAHREVGTEEFQNGDTSTGKKFTLTGLPVRTEIEVKARYTGTFQRSSDYSEVMRIFVL